MDILACLETSFFNVIFLLYLKFIYYCLARVCIKTFKRLKQKKEDYV